MTTTDDYPPDPPDPPDPDPFALIRSDGRLRSGVRGVFPDHRDHPGPGVLDGPAALARARALLADWVANHGH